MGFMKLVSENSKSKEFETSLKIKVSIFAKTISNLIFGSEPLL